MNRAFTLALIWLFIGPLLSCSDTAKDEMITNPQPEEEPVPDIIEPCNQATIKYPAAISSDPEPTIESNDLTIGWITRLPRLEYVWGSSNPERDGWPGVGEDVTWKAHIKNWSDSTKKNIAYQWFLDEVMVDSGRIDVQPGDYSHVEYKWNWTFDRHKLDFYIDTNNANTNKLSVYTDAISLGLYVEQRLYDYFHENQYKLGIGSNSFEGWAQRQIRFYNELFKRAVYDETPNGVWDRIRIDDITIVADGALPLVPPPDTDGFDPRQAKPNLNDRTVDLIWGFPSEFIQRGVYSDHTWIHFDNQFYYSGFLQHELGHARYLLDVYGFNVAHGLSWIDIKEKGQLIAGTQYLPGNKIITSGTEVLEVHQTIEKGLMNVQWKWMDRYSAIAMNLIKGHRATRGNYNGTENHAIFMGDLPKENRFRIKDRTGRFLKNAEIQIFQSSRNSQSNGDAYPKYFDDVPDLVLHTDQNAHVLLGQNPFSNDGQVAHSWRDFTNAVFIMRVGFEGRAGFTIIDISQFNLEYWRGNTEVADYDVCVPLF